MYVADLHCDTISEIYDRKKKGEQTELRSNHLKVDLERLKKGGYLLQNFAVFVDIGREKQPYLCAKRKIALFLEEMKKNKEKICQVKTMEDIRKNCREGRLSALLTLEEGEICEGDQKKLEEFYLAGVRMMTFTWNYENSLSTKQGLTELGIAFLGEMERLGILPDVSHLSDAGFYDVCRYARKPFVASHSNARALCGHERNLTDDMIQKIAEKGGVIGLNYYGLFLEEKEPHISSVKRIAEHILHMIDIGGISCVGLGSDFDGFAGGSELADCSKMELLERELKGRGLLASEIEAVFYKNVLRLYEECWREGR